MKKSLSYLALSISVLIIAFFVFFAQSDSDSSQPMESQISNNRQNEESMEASNPSQEKILEESDTNPDALLPDLWVKKLTRAYIATDADGNRTLRFPGKFANTGDGPLELEASRDKSGEMIVAIQIIYNKDGSTAGHFAGRFVFHPTHRHWHFEDFVSFALLNANDDGSPGEEIIGTGKVTYCIHDYGPLPDDYRGKPDSVVYPWCTTSLGRQGISVGWVDTYTADVPGQELDITDLSDGMYAFRAIADPENRLVEKDESNNTTFTFLEIAGNNVRILDEAP